MEFLCVNLSTVIYYEEYLHDILNRKDRISVVWQILGKPLFIFEYFIPRKCSYIVLKISTSLSDVFHVTIKQTLI